MAVIALLLLSVFQSLVHSQTFPYISFMGHTLVNHSFVDLSQVGFGYSNSVQCHYHGTSRCCTEDEYRGHWYFPNGTRVPVDSDVFESHGDHRVDIHNGLISGVLPFGIYRCEFLSNDSVSEAIYVGLYDNYEGTLY